MTFSPHSSTAEPSTSTAVTTGGAGGAPANRLDCHGPPYRFHRGIPLCGVTTIVDTMFSTMTTMAAGRDGGIPQATPPRPLVRET